MKRDIRGLANGYFDLLIVGGGIYGAAAAWDATLRGLSVALIDKADFAGATSANSLKIIHGGLRYLQQADLRRMRESIRERTALLRIAPHLVHPLPVIVPTYGHGLRGREVFAAALLFNDLISRDRDGLADPDKRLPPGRLLTRQECLELLPGLPDEGLTGAALFYDAQVYNSERLVLSFLRSAAAAGAQVANYVEAVGPLMRGNRVVGVEAEDVLSGQRLAIRARVVLIAAGPWLSSVLRAFDGKRLGLGIRSAKAVNVVTRQLFQTHAVGLHVHGAPADEGGAAGPGGQLLFIAPWRGCSLIGTVYEVHEGDPDRLGTSDEAADSLFNLINRAYPAAGLCSEDIRLVHRGLLPMTSPPRAGGRVCLARHSQIYDHRAAGVHGLLSILGVKYTTARGVAEMAIDQVFRLQGKEPPPSMSAATALHGGHIERFGAFLNAETRRTLLGLPESVIRPFLQNYGSAYGDVLRYLDRTNGGHAPLTQMALLRAETRHAVHLEMAQKLADVVFRRTELGTAGYPGDVALATCAAEMGRELAWSAARIRQELDETRGLFPQRDSVGGATAARVAAEAV